MTSIDVALSSHSLGGCTVLSLEGREAMDELAVFDVRVGVAGDVDLDALVRAPVLLTIVDPEEGSTRAAALVVQSAACEAGVGRDRVLHLRLVDPLFSLFLREGYRVFLDETVEGAVTEVLAGAGVPRSAIAPRLAGEYPRHPQIVQHGETEWDFVRRLLSDDGISIWTETAEDGTWRVVFGDGASSHDGIDGDTRLPYAGGGGARAPGVRALFALAWEESVAHDRVMVRELDVDQPDVFIDGEAGSGALEWLEYPARVPHARAAKAKAERRLEQLRRDEARVTAESDCVRLRPGRLLSIAGGGDLFEQRMLVTEVRHHFARPLKDGGAGSPYRSEVVLRPTRGAEGEARPHHRPPILGAPRLSHMESAVVTGAPGEEIHVDHLGRVKLRFLWDRSGVTDDRSSSWTRGLQWPLAGAMLLPRVGWEVAVGFLDGLPERPFVLGRLYNATAVHPYPLPASRAVTAVQSWTSPEDGTTQGIRLGDDAGGEEFSLHAARDLTVSVGGSAKTVIDGNETHAVGLSLSTSVLDAYGVTVGGDQTIDVKEPIRITIDGANREVVAAETIDVVGNRAVLADGQYLEAIGGLYGVQCNQSNTKTTGDFMRIVAGAHIIGSGLGVTESVGGVRTYVCQGARIVQCAGAYSESVTGGKQSSAGAVRHSATGDLGTAAPVGTFTSGLLDASAGGKFSIRAGVVNIVASAGIEAGSLQIKGSAVKVTSGKATIRGTTKRQRGGEVGS
ncbi:type VI secretion system Vgr family protein [Polyangium aurulentum]|uniref:type VI secretion system Vgr family protein n=1 Tax=Polyangium aurulentum TaxID=2567896 RepID=UPI0010AE2514|nr:type VI secretion system tip protein TssI/VgrG [Polyangium aurulentum]UQA58483.1 type VI secretion system tip protein VgrG [Polyangium aurulentum]